MRLLHIPRVRKLNAFLDILVYAFKLEDVLTLAKPLN
ncbi:MAG: hypothetical protein AOA65_0007 [Candidatus Bathyarchaeota archaeon BA1]|nr:MAG: hypothetical protein AOA65_0007 [Candidatus Bathyarchaeota archaeon BA1]